MTDLAMTFLKELEQNNNREWFLANKARYEKARVEMEKLVGDLITGIALFDPSVKFVSAKDCMFRIFRDVRFSKNKDPYKNNFGGWITRNGRKGPGPGYYVHVQPGQSFLAAGVYMPDPSQLKKIRQEIFHNLAGLKEILAAGDMVKYTKGLDEMDKLKKPPRDFPPDFPGLDILKNRHFTVSCALSDREMADAAFPVKALKVFKAMYPLNSFLGRALDG